MRKLLIARLAAAAAVLLVSAPSSIAQPADAPGILLLAHGGKPQWNEHVRTIAAAVDPKVPVEVAFGMATRANIQSAIDRLVARRVTRIIAVPLFVSSHSSVITSTEYLLGLRAEAPPELAIYAKMNHGSHGAPAANRTHAAQGPHGAPAGGHDHHAHAPVADGSSPVVSPVPIRMSAALNSHTVVSDILTTRAVALSRDAAREAVIFVAHGPVPDDDNRRWLDDMAVVARRVAGKTSFGSIDYLTVRDDASAPVKAAATAELRALVTRRAEEGKRVLVVPLLLSYGGIEEGIRKRLEGLTYEMSPQGLIPDDRIAGWILDMASLRQ